MYEVEPILGRKGLQYERQILFPERFYYADFYLPEHRTIIEVTNAIKSESRKAEDLMSLSKKGFKAILVSPFPAEWTWRFREYGQIRVVEPKALEESLPL